MEAGISPNWDESTTSRVDLKEALRFACERICKDTSAPRPAAVFLISNRRHEIYRTQGLRAMLLDMGCHQDWLDDYEGYFMQWFPGGAITFGGDTSPLEKCLAEQSE